MSGCHIACAVKKDGIYKMVSCRAKIHAWVGEVEPVASESRSFKKYESVAEGNKDGWKYSRIAKGSICPHCAALPEFKDLCQCKREGPVCSSGFFAVPSWKPCQNYIKHGICGHNLKCHAPHE